MAGEPSCPPTPAKATPSTSPTQPSLPAAAPGARAQGGQRTHQKLIPPWVRGGDPPLNPPSTLGNDVRRRRDTETLPSPSQLCRALGFANKEAGNAPPPPLAQKSAAGATQGTWAQARPRGTRAAVSHPHA